jgi:hypothetical protein
MAQHKEPGIESRRESFCVVLGSIFEFLLKLLHRWIRRSRMARFARSHGWSFRAGEIGSAFPVPANIFSTEPSKAYKLSSAANVIRGSLHGLGFTYFEQTLIVDSGFSVGDAAGTRSVVALYGSATESFESEAAFAKHLIFYCENENVYFLWNNSGSVPEAIPIKQLDQWLADIAGTFKTRVRAPALACE